MTALFFASCQDGNETKKEVIETVPQEATLEQKRQQLQSVAPSSNANNANRSATAAGANPPHGQPGHRCDIPVGAPLDGSSTIKTSSGQTAPIRAQSDSPVNATGKGLNPPHGQPGHRCDVKVGDPLP